MTDLIPIGQAYHGQILDQLRGGPKTPLELAKVFRPQWSKTDPAGAAEMFALRLADMAQTGDVREVEPGRWELCPVSDGPDEATEATGELSGNSGDNGALPTAGTVDSDTAKENQTVAKRGRKPKPKDGAAAPVKSQQSLPPDGEEIAGHLDAISKVEDELSECKISYEDALNVRRLKKAALDVAKSERRRFSVHEGSNLAQIKASQKSVDKAEKQFKEAQANALEAKNRVNSVEEKLARTIAGVMPLFDDGGDGDEGDDE